MMNVAIRFTPVDEMDVMDVMDVMDEMDAEFW